MRTKSTTTLRRVTSIAAGSALMAGGLIAFSPVSPAGAAGTSTSFAYTGTTQTFNVPTGVQSVSVTADGGAGATGSAGGSGAKAGVTAATIDLGGAASVAVNVGGAGSGATGGFNGGGNGATGGALGTGGGGGGATDLRINGNRLLVAPGGGGGGGNGNGNKNRGVGGAGGAGSQNGAAGGGGTNNNTGEGDGGAAAQKPSGTGAAGGAGISGSVVFRTGGGGGGGGGGFAGGDGGGGGSRGIQSSGAGGGGGGGNAYVAPSATNVSYAGTGTGNGGVTINYVDITTTGLADGRVGEPYSATLAAVGGTGPYTWTLNNSGDLPAGILFDDATGVLSGTPSAAADVTLSFTVTDSTGLETDASFELDILPTTAIVGDAPATNIGITTATGNGVMYPGGGSAQPITAGFCSISTSANMSSATTVAVTPAAPFVSTTNVSCPFSGLRASTAYYFTLSATQPTTGTETSSSPQSFETEAKAVQTFNAPFPKAIKYKGLTQLLKKKSKTSAGKPIKVSLAKSTRAAYNTRGDVRFFKKITKKNGKVLVQTFGKKFFLKVTYSAAGSAKVAPYKSQKVYLVRKAKK